jgi:hypothetical protein
MAAQQQQQPTQQWIQELIQFWVYYPLPLAVGSKKLRAELHPQHRLGDGAIRLGAYSGAYGGAKGT